MALDEAERELEERLEKVAQNLGSKQQDAPRTSLTTFHSRSSSMLTKVTATDPSMPSRSRSLSASAMTIKPSEVTGVRKTSLTQAPSRPVSDQGKRPFALGQVQCTGPGPGGGKTGSGEIREEERDSQPTPVEEVSVSARLAWSH